MGVQKGVQKGVQVLSTPTKLSVVMCLELSRTVKLLLPIMAAVELQITVRAEMDFFRFFLTEPEIF